MKKVISFILSVLLLMSSTGITYAQHFCGDYEMLAKVTLGQEHLSCGMQTIDVSCGDETEGDHDCCENEYAQVTTDDNFSTVDFNFEINPEFTIAFVSVFLLQNLYYSEKEQTVFAQYNPPPLLKDIPVLYQSYLI